MLTDNDDQGPQRGTGTIIVAPPPEAGLITGFLQAQKKSDGSGVFSIIAREQEIGPGLIESLRSLFGGSDHPARWSARLQGGGRAGDGAPAWPGRPRDRLPVPAVGDWFDAVAETGALVYRLPLRAEPFEELAQTLAQLLVEARQKHAQRALSEAIEAEEEAAGIEAPEGGSAFRAPAGRGPPSHAGDRRLVEQRRRRQVHRGGRDGLAAGPHRGT